MTLTKEQQIAALLRVLRPGAPAAWVIAASKIPQAGGGLTQPPAASPKAPATDADEHREESSPHSAEL